MTMLDQSFQKTRDVVIREDVTVKECDERPVRIEEIVTRVFERPTVEEHVRYVQKVIEVERRVPEYEIVEKEMEIYNNTPRVEKRYVEVPKVVEETVVVPSKQKKTIELNPVIDKIVPKLQHRVVEKVIEKPMIVEIPKTVIVDKKKPVPGPKSQADVPVVISHVMLPPVVRESGVVEVPVTRIVPKIEYVDIVVPNRSITEEELSERIQCQVQYRLIHQSFRPILDATQALQKGESVAISSHRQEDDVQVEVRAGSGAKDSENYEGLFVDFQHSKTGGSFTCADYNSWLLVLNEHLKDPASLGFTGETEIDERPNLVNALPFIRSSDGSVSFLQPGIPMDGQVLPPSYFNGADPGRGRQIPEDLRRPYNGY